MIINNVFGFKNLSSQSTRREKMRALPWGIWDVPFNPEVSMAVFRKGNNTWWLLQWGNDRKRQQFCNVVPDLGGGSLTGSRKTLDSQTEGVLWLVTDKDHSNCRTLLGGRNLRKYRTPSVFLLGALIRTPRALGMRPRPGGSGRWRDTFSGFVRKS